ncbi:MAG TPA: sulfatase [Solirubrobacteraceae bacterium]|nr:sulfatase [Solirubrobacteraceae bacterium]
MRGRIFRLTLALVAVVSLATGVATSSRGSEAPRPEASPPAAAALPHASATHLGAPRDLVAPSRRPNIVVILTADLSMNLVRYMPHVVKMQDDGLTFNHYFVSDSLCCPSRSSIFTGNFPHDTKVFNNVGARGGFREFYDRGEELHTFATALQNAGYRTAMMGKYLNGYGQTKGSVPGLPYTYVPPGWSEWDVAGWGYPEFNYSLNEDGQLQYYGGQPKDYLTDVLARKGVDFINSSAATGQPFFLELATFAPHSPYTPAPRDANDFPGLQAPQPANFNRLPSDPPRWLAGRPPLDAAQIEQINSVFRRRVQAVQAVDEMIGQIEGALAANGLSGDTYLVFSSDNGLHTGEYRLMPGKMTAFDTDIHVPLVISGPGIPAGMTTNAMAENVDLAKTFTQIGGTTLAGDGHSLMPLFGGLTPADWRNAILVEHRGPHLIPSDPDFQRSASGNPTSYEAMRTSRFLYVEYSDGEREIYNLVNDPFELHNLAGSLTLLQLEELHAELLNLEHCHDGLTCWAAMHVQAPPGLIRSLRRGRRPGALLRRRHHRQGAGSGGASLAYVA